MLHSDDDSLHKRIDAVRRVLPAPEQELQMLIGIARPAIESRRLAPDRMRELILSLCASRYLSAAQLAALTDRNVVGLANRFLSPMVRQGELLLLFPGERNRPDQAYTASRMEAVDERV